MTKICVLGLGYMGLPTAILFSEKGYDVVGVDIDEDKIKSLNNGKIYIDEKGLQERFDTVFSSGKFTVKNSIVESDIFLIAVPTPLDRRTNQANLNYVKSAGKMIKSVLNKGNLVILESTVPPNTCNKKLIPILEKAGLKSEVDFLVACCPEVAIPGNTVYELIHNNRIIGGNNMEACKKTEELYSTFCKGEMFLTDLTTAETTKLISNTYRAVNIAYVNELVKISEDFKIDVWEAINLANKSPRTYLHTPGPGVGGHCIPIDPWFLTENTDQAKLIQLSETINESMPTVVFDLIHNQVKNISKPTVSILGVAFKPDVDDYRESPALEVIRLCEESGYELKISDPHVFSFEHDLVDLDTALTDTDCVVIITNHKLYDDLKISDFSRLRKKLIIDTRNCINKIGLREAGYTVITLGDYKS